MSKIVSTIIGDIDLSTYKRLKRAYNKALVMNADYFTWNMEPMHTEFAKQLIEFLDPHFKHIK